MRVFIIGKMQKRIIAITLAVVLAAVLAYPWVVRADQKLTPVYQVDTQKPMVALTFDVAWGDSDLEEILSILNENDAKATFFVTGEWARRLPDGVNRIIDEGHGVENHSDNHPHVAKISTEALLADTKAADQTLAALTGKSPVYYRAPYGEYDNEMMQTLQDYQVIQWNIDSRDWKEGARAQNIASQVVEHIAPGSILLFHVDAKPGQTPEALRRMFSALDGEYQFVLLDELLPKEGYQVDTNGIAHAA